MTSGAVKHIAKFNASVGKPCAAHGAWASRFAGYLEAVFIERRCALAATVIADHQVPIAVEADGRSAVLADHRFSHFSAKCLTNVGCLTNGKGH